MSVLFDMHRLNPKQALKTMLARQKICVLSYSRAPDCHVFQTITEIEGQLGLTGMSYAEAVQLFRSVKAVLKIPGDVAEVGVYKGASARLICEAKGPKVVHLFDTFAGIPAVDAIDASTYAVGQYACDLDTVQRYLSSFEGVEFHPGVFPESARSLGNLTFAFVHLDLDTYRSTHEALQYFYPRLSPGAILMSHDYLGAPGVSKAIDEFFKDRPEPVVQLPSSQCLIVKTWSEGFIS